MDVIYLQQKFTREFIETYRLQPCLWDVKSADYKQKSARQIAYDAMVTKSRQYIAEADHDFVKAKINNLRTTFRKELRRVKQMKEEGKVYTPSLWYYKLFSFISNDEGGGGEQEVQDELTIKNNESLLLDAAPGVSKGSIFHKVKLLPSHHKCCTLGLRVLFVKHHDCIQKASLIMCCYIFL